MSALPVLYELRIVKGSRLALDFTPKRGTASNPGANWYAFGASDRARAQVRPSRSSPTVMLSMTTENGLIVLTGGTIRLDVPATTTDDDVLVEGTAEWSLEIVPGNVEASAFALLAGPCMIEGETTRP